MNTDLRKKAKNEFEKDFFKLMNNSVFGKIIENIRHYRDVHLVTADKKRKKLVSEPNYQATKHFSEDESGDDIMIKHCSPKPKTHVHLFNNNGEVKKAKRTKKCS